MSSGRSVQRGLSGQIHIPSRVPPPGRFWLQHRSQDDIYVFVSRARAIPTADACKKSYNDAPLLVSTYSRCCSQRDDSIVVIIVSLKHVYVGGASVRNVQFNIARHERLKFPINRVVRKTSNTITHIDPT